MGKLIGIIVSPGYGAGWSTYGKPEMALDQELADAIDRSASYDEILHIAEKNWPGEYYGGLADCIEVEYVEEGTPFRIDEYDGNETLILSNDFAPAIPWRKE